MTYFAIYNKQYTIYSIHPSIGTCIIIKIIIVVSYTVIRAYTLYAS